MTEIESEQLATFVSEAWPQNKMTEMTCTIYAAKFRPLDFEATKAAILRLMDTNVHRPAFAEIRKTANRKRNLGEVGASKVRALTEGAKRGVTVDPRIASWVEGEAKKKRLKKTKGENQARNDLARTMAKYALTDEARRRKEKSGERQ